MNHTVFQFIRFLTVPSLMVVGLLASSAAFAHSGHAIESTSWLSSLLAGIAHPLTGVDHVTMFVGMGFIAAQCVKKTQILQVMLFVAVVLIVGMGMGSITGVGTGIENVILGSLFVAAMAVYFQQGGLKTLLSVFAIVLVLFHGWAHGLESSGQVLLGFIPGMLLSATFLMTVGLAMASKMSHRWQGAILAGSSIVVALVS